MIAGWEEASKSSRIRSCVLVWALHSSRSEEWLPFMLCSSTVSGLDSRSYSVVGLMVFEALAIAVGDDSSMKSSGFNSDYSGSYLRF